MFNYHEIYQAYLECRKNKRNTRDALEFESNQEENLNHLLEALNNRSYRPTTSVCFYIDKPKPREIFAAAFQDRIVHHLLYRKLAPTWEKIFIHSSFACRPKKGTHKAAQVLQDYLRKITCNGKKPAYYLKMDVRNFYMSINKHVLYKLLCKKCRNKDLKWLLEVVIFHDPTEDYEQLSSDRLLQKIPPQKSLFNLLADCGLPIGNLTSQFFANVYLNALDQFVKHVLKCHFYLRYVDDFILLAYDKAQLLIWQQKIIEFLENELLLSINEHATRIDSVFNGVDFVGFIGRPFYKLCRRRVVGNCKAKLRAFKTQLVTEENSKITWKYDPEQLEQLMATMNSYLGHFRHAQTRKMVQQLFIDFSFLNEYFYLNQYRLIRKYRPTKYVKRFRHQVVFYTKLFPDTVVLFQVGCYFEAYGLAARKLSATLKYQLRRKGRGFSPACGFHQRFLNKVCCQLEANKVNYVIIRQTGRLLSFTRERLPQVRVQFVN